MTVRSIRLIHTQGDSQVNSVKTLKSQQESNRALRAKNPVSTHLARSKVALRETPLERFTRRSYYLNDSFVLFHRNLSRIVGSKPQHVYVTSSRDS